MIFRIYHKLLGGHVHARVFVGKESQSLGLAGELVMREDEFVDFRRKLLFGHGYEATVHFVEENQTWACS